MTMRSPYSLLALLTLAAATARPQERVPALPRETLPPVETPTMVPAPEPCTAGCAATIQKSIPLKEIMIREHQEATTVPALAPREVEACQGTRTDLQIKWLEERRTCAGIELRPRETFQEVTCMTTRTDIVKDPCTGACTTVCNQVPVTKRVKITVFEVVPVEKHYLVKTPCLKPVEVNTVTKRIVIDSITVPAIRKTLEAIPVECCITIEKPACPLPCPIR